MAKQPFVKDIVFLHNFMDFADGVAKMHNGVAKM